MCFNWKKVKLSRAICPYQQALRWQSFEIVTSLIGGWGVTWPTSGQWRFVMYANKDVQRLTLTGESVQHRDWDRSWQGFRKISVKWQTFDRLADLPWPFSCWCGCRAVNTQPRHHVCDKSLTKPSFHLVSSLTCRKHTSKEQVSYECPRETDLAEEIYCCGNPQDDGGERCCSTDHKIVDTVSQKWVSGQYFSYFRLLTIELS